MGNSSIVNRINGLLAEQGISKQDFYRECGITSASYSLWNTGKTTPRMKNLKIIAEYLGTTTDYLLTGLGEKENPAPVDDTPRPLSDKERILLDNFSRLNEFGKGKAIERIEELAELSKYQRSDKEPL